MAKNILKKRFLTTGDIAELCGVNFRTVIRWIDKGLIKAHQLPGGRGDNRVQPGDFIEFLKENNMPIPEEFDTPGQRVLIVEDEKPMAKAIQRALKRAGFETMMASDGFLAGMIAMSFKPAVITLDLKMPGLGGLEVLKALRNEDELQSTKILIVSAMPEEQLEEALRAGADDILEKPFKNKELVAKIRTLLEEKPKRKRPYRKAR